MNLRKLNEELSRLLEENTTFEDVIAYLKKWERNRGFFILDTTPEIRAWEFWREKSISFRCQGISLVVKFGNNIVIEKWLDVVETLPITTMPEQLIKVLQDIFNKIITEEKKKEEERRQREKELNEKVKIWEKEWNDNIDETNEIFKTLKENGFTNFIFTEDTEALNDFGADTPDDLVDVLTDYLDYEPDTRWYAASVEKKGLIIGDWTGWVSGTYLAGGPDDLHDINFEDERFGDIYLSIDVKDFILKQFPDSYLAKCFKEN